MRTFALTATALIAFASNSLLCRLALRHEAIDPATFATVRLAAGAAVFILIARRRAAPRPAPRGAWVSAAFLFLYAAPFSFAYVSLDAGTGALILFGAVQVTMMAAAIARGARPGPRQWIGLAVAFAGLVYLVSPGLTAPPLHGALLMALAGASWGAYSLLGRRAADPIAQTAGNFARSVPMALAVSLFAIASFHATPDGLLLAAASGALASGLGYVIWYMALRRISTLTAAIVQLAVPPLAATGGAAILDEEISVRLLLAALLVLGGIALAIGRRRASGPGSSAG